MNKRKSARWHTIYSIVSTLIQEVAIAALLIWLLPLFSIRIPVWGIVAILLVFPVYGYIMYRIGHPTISYQESVGPESIIGASGVAASPLKPDGYVKVTGELWRATAIDSPLEMGDDIVVVGINGLQLTVSGKPELPAEGLQAKKHSPVNHPVE